MILHDMYESAGDELLLQSYRQPKGVYVKSYDTDKQVRVLKLAIKRKQKTNFLVFK